MFTDELKQLINNTPGVLLSDEAATDLVEDIQAVTIKHLPRMIDRATKPSLEFAQRVSEADATEFGTRLHNLVYEWPTAFEHMAKGAGIALPDNWRSKGLPPTVSLAMMGALLKQLM